MNVTSSPSYVQIVSNISSAKLEEIESHPLVQAVALVVFIAYIVIFLFGVPANVFVVFRLHKLSKEDYERYTNGTGSGLFTMAVADLLSLVTISLQNVLFSFDFNVSGMTKSILCKILIFGTHTFTSVSIWSCLLMSSLRYLAVRHPLFHLRLWRMPYHAIILIIFMSSLTNSWLLIPVEHGKSGCGQRSLTSDESLNRWFLLIEWFWSFCIPVVVILYMDTMGASGVWKWLTIAFIDVLLNAPENIYRLIILCGMPNITGNKYHFSARMVAQLLYFSQFAFNSVYLALFVFDKSISSRKPSESTHICSLCRNCVREQEGDSVICENYKFRIFHQKLCETEV